MQNSPNATQQQKVLTGKTPSGQPVQIAVVGGPYRNYSEMYAAVDRGQVPGCPRSNPNLLSPVVRFPLSDGDRGTAETIAKIRKLVHQGMTDQYVNRTAIGIVRGGGIPQFDFAGEIRAIFEWVRHNIRFTRDIAGIETLRTASEILQVKAGDCDDINSVLLPSLLGTIGHHVRLVTISSDPSAPRSFSHIYCEVELQGRWIPLDSARRDAAFGRAPQRYFRKRIWSLTDSDYRDVSGLGYYSAGSQPRRPARRMGDFTDIAGGIAQLIGAGGTATASIINATNGGIVPAGFARNPATGQLVPLTPTGSFGVTSVPGGVVTAASGSIPNWVLYGGVAFLGLMMLEMVKK